MDDVYNTIANNPTVLYIGVIGSVIGGLGLAVIGAVRKHIVHKVWGKMLPSRVFWQPNPSTPPLYAVSLLDFDKSEDTLYTPTGDALALAQISQFLERFYRKLKHDLYSKPDEPYTEWDRNVILIGGGKSNITTRCLLAALNPPLDSRDHKYEEQAFDFKGLENRCGQVVCKHEQGKSYETLSNDTKRLYEDYAYVIRAPAPTKEDKYVFIVVGGYAIGTYAAARWVSQPKNLLWLRLHSCWNHLRERQQELCKRRDKSERANSFQVLLQVTVPYSELSLSTLSNASIEVWDEKTKCWDEKQGKGKPYYFHQPKSYIKDYYNWVLVAKEKW